MTEGMLSQNAVLSNCGFYRYLLHRQWDAHLPEVTFVMLNPSTADAEKDDATIRSCMRLARGWSYGGIRVVNLFAWRATDPKKLTSADDPVGPENDAFIMGAVMFSDFIICAWGANKFVRGRDKTVLKMIQSRKPPHCLGVTKSGAPKHPLYIKSGTVPILYGCAPSDEGEI